MAWLLLMGAIVSEVAGTVSLRFTAGFSRLWPSLGVVVGYGLSFYLLSLVLRRAFPLSTAYAVWSGVGTALIAVIGVAALGESIGPVKVLGLVLVIAGVVLLNLVGAH